MKIAVGLCGVDTGLSIFSHVRELRRSSESKERGVFATACNRKSTQRSNHSNSQADERTRILKQWLKYARLTGPRRGGH